MKKYEIFFAKQAFKDFKKLSPKFQKKLKKILQDVISMNPYMGKKLLGDLEGNYSFRLNIKDRIVYGIDEKGRRVYIKRTKTHYGD